MENYRGIIANGGVVCYNYSAEKLSYFKTGGKIDVLLRPSKISDISKDTLPESFVVLGACTNTLISDNGVRGAVVSTGLLKGIDIISDSIYASGGETVSKLCAFAGNNSLSGIEQLNGIPGSIGGAVIMNAGCFGREIAEVIEFVDAYIDGKIERLNPTELKFAYRSSALKGAKNTIIAGVSLKLVKGSRSDIASLMKVTAEKRRARQPIGPSLGSVFRAADGVAAGRLIEECGFKGASLGGAKVSEKHANFIINSGSATSADYTALAEMIRNGVRNRKSTELKREVIYLKEDAAFDIE